MQLTASRSFYFYVSRRFIGNGNDTLVMNSATKGVLPALGQQITKRIMSGEHDHSLVNNVVLNNTDSGWSHLELTKDHIRIEYNIISKEYQDTAAMYFETEEELTERGIPLCFKPVKLENKVAIGGGATVFLDRSEISDFLKLYSTSNDTKIGASTN